MPDDNSFDTNKSSNGNMESERTVKRELSSQSIYIKA